MNPHVLIRRAVVLNFKSIRHCDVRLGALTFLAGLNGAGKSNFLDALQFLSDALTGSLDLALQQRGGLSQVLRQSSERPASFGIRVDFSLPDGRECHYAFSVATEQTARAQVQQEECVIGGLGRGPSFHRERGLLRHTSEVACPPVTAGGLALAAVAGLAVFRPVFEALSSVVVYNLDPKRMRAPHKPQGGRALKPTGENIASVIGHLERVSPRQLVIIEEYLRSMVPELQGVRRTQLGPMETLEFLQGAGWDSPRRFLAKNMSDGTLHALGVLAALFQGNPDYAPSLVGIDAPERALHPVASAALREALAGASRETQVIVASHSSDLVDDPSLSGDSFLAVLFERGKTQIAPIDGGSRAALRDERFSAGELLRIDQLAPDRSVLEAQQAREAKLFGEQR